MKTTLHEIRCNENKLLDDLDSIPEIFTNSVRGIMLIKRNKDGEYGNAQRKAVKRITLDSNDWKKTIIELYLLQQTSHQGFRIYSSVNSRNMSKAIHEFKRRQLEVDFGNEFEYYLFYNDIENRFFSCLMNPNCRESNYFLIDCDSEEEYAHAAYQLKDSDLVIKKYKTKNGYHIITQPFNPNDYVHMEIKKDAMLYIG